MERLKEALQTWQRLLAAPKHAVHVYDEMPNGL
jgi:hypothetical protein